jgi:purine-binding chemotaxis protein CheW
VTESERYETLLAERSAALASRTRGAAQVSELREYLVCAVGAERFGFPLSSVAAVLFANTCTPLPGAAAALRGIIAHAGTIVTVIDLGRALGLGAGDAPEETGHFVRLRAAGPPVAVAVDRVVGVAAVAAEAVADSSKSGDAERFGTDAVSGYAPPVQGRESAASDGFAIIDPVLLLRPFLP